MKTLIVGDIHIPAEHPGYLAFCQDLYYQWQCDNVVFIGDIVDHHAISFHAGHPECPGPNDEYELAYPQVQKWYKAFPKAKVCIGNHDGRVVRLAESVNIPARFIRNYKETWDTPGWDWQYDFMVDNFYAFHGVGAGGQYPAVNAARKKSMNVVCGHTHSAFGVWYWANPERRFWGMNVGCGVDDRAMAFAYGRHFINRSVLGAAVVIDGIPYAEPMPIGPNEKYHRSKFQ